MLLPQIRRGREAREKMLAARAAIKMARMVTVVWLVRRPPSGVRIGPRWGKNRLSLV